MQRALKYFFQTMLLGSAMLAFGTLLLFVRVSFAPVPLDLLTPYLQRVLNQENGPYLFTLSHTTVRWVQETHALDLQVSVRMKRRNGQTVALSPSLLFSFRMPALIRGVVTPYAVKVLNSHLYLCRTPESLIGLCSSVKGEGEGPLISTPMRRKAANTFFNIENFIERIFNTSLTTGSHLKRISFTDSSVTLDDQVIGLTWTAHDIDLEWTHDHDGIGIDGQLLVQTGDGLIPVMLTGHQATCEQWLSLTLTVANLRPTTLPFLEKAPAVYIDLPVACTLSAQLDANYQWHNFKFFITSNMGVLTLFPFSVTRYAVRSLSLKGTMSSDFHSLMIDKAAFDLGRQSLLLVAYIVWRHSGHDIESAFHKTSFARRHGEQGIYRRPSPFFPLARSLGLRSLLPFLSPIPDHTLAAATEITLKGLSVDDLIRCWPSRVAPSPRHWTVTNLHDGTIEEFRLFAILNGKSLKELTAEHLHNRLTIRDVTIHYLQLMPPIRHINATVTFHPDWLEMRSESGKIQDLRLTDADMMITGLQQENPFCMIELTFVSSVDSVLHLVNSSASLGEAATALVLLQSLQKSGMARAKLALAFPVEKNLALEHIAIKSQIYLYNIKVNLIIKNIMITKGNFVLTLDTQKMYATGRVIIKDTFFRLEWEEFFKHLLTSSLKVRSRYIAHSCFENAQWEVLLGDWVPFLIPPHMNGPVQTNLFASVGFDGLGTAVVETDFAAADIGWGKISSQPGRATMTMRFPSSATMLYAIPRFTVATREATLGGSVAFTRAGRLERLVLNHLQLGRTELSGVLVPTRTGGLILHMIGPALDLDPLLNAAPKYFAHYARNKNLKYTVPIVQDILLDLKVARLWGSQQSFLSTATLKALQQGGLWRHCSLDAFVGRKDTVKITLTSMDDAVSPAQVVTVTSENAGVVLQVLDLFNKIRGGRMRVNAVIDDGLETRGTMQVDDYRLVNIPLLARLLTMATLTGLLESLTGDGMRFTRLDMAFVIYESIFSIAHLYSAGPSLGLTANGKLFLKEKRLKIYGTIIPIYFINSIIGNILSFKDIVFQIKNCGLFSFTYYACGNLKNPSIKINPIVVFIPSFLRDLFMFSGCHPNHGERSRLDFSSDRILSRDSWDNVF